MTVRDDDDDANTVENCCPLKTMRPFIANGHDDAQKSESLYCKLKPSKTHRSAAFEDAYIPKKTKEHKSTNLAWQMANH